MTDSARVETEVGITRRVVAPANVTAANQEEEHEEYYYDEEDVDEDESEDEKAVSV